jgi:sugar phosphate isomerase/epimerase
VQGLKVKTMKLGHNGATTMTSSLETDIRIAGEAGFDMLEITAMKLDRFLEKHAIAEARELIDATRLKILALNSIEKINFRDAQGRAEMLARTRQLCKYAQALACSWLIAVPWAAPEETKWDAIRDDTVGSLRAMSEVAGSYGVSMRLSFSDSRGARCEPLQKVGDRAHD